MLAGILNGSTNTGLDSELSSLFVAPMTLRSNQPVAASDSLNLKRITSDHIAQRWEIDANVMPTNESPQHLINSLMFGYTKRFYVRPPQAFRFSSDGSSGSPKLSVEAGANAKSISFSGGVLVPGELVNIGDPKVTGDYKLYVILSVSGSVAEIAPPLRKATPVNSEIMIGAKATMRVMFDNTSLVGMVYTDGVLLDPGTITLIEAL